MLSVKHNPEVFLRQLSTWIDDVFLNSQIYVIKDGKEAALNFSLRGSNVNKPPEIPIHHDLESHFGLQFVLHYIIAGCLETGKKIVFER